MSVKTMKPFEYHAPLTMEELFGILDEYQEKAVIIAGGTGYEENRSCSGGSRIIIKNERF